MIDAHAERQAALYQGIWAADPSYGTRMEDVLDTVKHRIVPHVRRLFPFADLDVVDFGAGDGRFLFAMLQELPRMVFGTGVDLHVPRGKLPRGIGWIGEPLWDAVARCFDYAISTDTLEHMPPEKVAQVLANIRASAPHGFLRISTKQDIYGTERGLHLHETVQPPEWWLEQARAAGIEPSSWRIYPGHAIEIWF
ncbi:MAG: methyltransferase domain-containing protein [Steroidobacteraceae bacterium]